MITIRHPVDLPDIYPLDRIGPLKDLLSFDIEITGFSGDTPQLYLISRTYHDDFGWKLIQWSADSRESERELLTAFFTFMERFKILVHFNGDGFNVPYLLKCCRRLDLPYNSDHIKSVGIYKKIKPYRRLLGLENVKRKSIEQFLGLARKGRYNGGQLIEVYHEYLMTHESFLYDLLILHNEGDLKDVPSILPILSYADMMEAPFSLEPQQLFTYDDIAGNACPFLSLTWKSRCAIPAPLVYDNAPVSLELNQSTLIYSIALYQGELKYFYSNYKDYYYLSLEDTAIHKSVGEHVDRDTHTKATARTYYTRRQGLSLPQFDALWSPALVQKYKTSLTCAEHEPEMLTPDNMADAYTRQVLSYVNQAKEL